MKRFAGVDHVFVVLCVATMCGVAGCSHEVKIHQYDQPVVTALTTYRAEYKLNEDGRVVELKLDGEQVDDAAMALLPNLTELQSLSLYGSSITDNGLQHLVGLGRLESLGLGKTLLTDRALGTISQIPNLKWVWLGEKKSITSRGIAQLKKARPGLTVFE